MNFSHRRTQIKHRVLLCDYGGIGGGFHFRSHVDVVLVVGGWSLSQVGFLYWGEARANYQAGLTSLLGSGVGCVPRQSALGSMLGSEYKRWSTPKMTDVATMCVEGADAHPYVSLRPCDKEA